MGYLELQDTVREQGGELGRYTRLVTDLSGEWRGRVGFTRKLARPACACACALLLPYEQTLTARALGLLGAVQTVLTLTPPTRPSLTKR